MATSEEQEQQREQEVSQQPQEPHEMTLEERDAENLIKAEQAGALTPPAVAESPEGESS